MAKRHGVIEQTIYTWRRRFGGFQANDVRRLRQPEAENARLIEGFRWSLASNFRFIAPRKRDLAVHSTNSKTSAVFTP